MLLALEVGVVVGVLTTVTMLARSNGYQFWHDLQLNDPVIECGPIVISYTFPFTSLIVVTMQDSQPGSEVGVAAATVVISTDVSVFLVPTLVTVVLSTSVVVLFSSQ